MATVETMRELMERGIPYDDALRRVNLGDSLYDRAEALMDAIGAVREALCINLDAPAGWSHNPADYPDPVPGLDAAWSKFREAVEEAQRVEPVDIAAGERGK